MINTLYKCFQHWSEKGSIYIISDTHFMDIDMNWRYMKIPGKYWEYDTNKQEGIANYIVDNINAIARKNDTLIILGDVGDVSYIKKLKAGHKVLIKGNHDSGTENYLKREYCGYGNCRDERCSYDCRLDKHFLFDEVYDGPLIISDKIILSHEPIDTPFLFNIHGHCHDKDYINKSNELNVCCEKIEFSPISLKDIINSGKLKNVDSIHRITIDKATSRKLNGDN